MTKNRTVKEAERKQDYFQQVNRDQVDEVFDAAGDFPVDFIETQPLPECDRRIPDTVGIEFIGGIDATLDISRRYITQSST